MDYIKLVIDYEEYDVGKYYPVIKQINLKEHLINGEVFYYWDDKSNTYNDLFESLKLAREYIMKKYPKDCGLEPFYSWGNEYE